MNGRAVGVALLAVLAGCSLLGGSGPATDTVTPAPVPDQTAGTPTLPPGLAGDGVTDLDALIGAHLDAVAATSYVWTDRSHRIYDGSASVRSLDRQVVFVNGTTYYWDLDPRPIVVRWWSTPRLDDERYADGHTRYSYRTVPGGDPVYAVRRARDASRQLAWVSALSVELYLGLPDATVSTVRVDGERYFRVEASRERYSLPVPGESPVYNYSVRALVAPTGLVERLNATYLTERSAFGTRVTYRYEFREVGTATLTRPDWVDDARARAGTPVPTATAAPGRLGSDGRRTNFYSTR